MKKAADTYISFVGMVTVIVPVYNSGKYLHQCIKSVINQSYKNFEIILINDGSTDNSGEICDGYAKSGNRIRVIHTKNNGPAAARNIGIKNSKGDFIFFLDSDDFIENNALTLLVENNNKYKVDLVVGDFKKIKDNNSGSIPACVFSSDKLLTKQDIIDYARCYLKKPNRFLLFAYSWGRLFKSSVIKKNNIFFNTELHTFEDVAFNFDYLNNINRIFFLKEPVYNHLINNNYMSATMTISDNPKKLFGYIQAINNISVFLKNSNSDADIKKEAGHTYIYLTIIQFVRMCGQINNYNGKKIHRIIREIINNPNIRDNLRFYSPEKDDSRILPVLMKLKLVWLIIRVCKYKAHKRYGKESAGK